MRLCRTCSASESWHPATSLFVLIRAHTQRESYLHQPFWHFSLFLIFILCSLHRVSLHFFLFLHLAYSTYSHTHFSYTFLFGRVQFEKISSSPNALIDRYCASSHWYYSHDYCYYYYHHFKLIYIFFTSIW